MNIKKHIPNLFTLGNLFCGTLATIYAVTGQFEWVLYLVFLGIVFDFFDGFLARILGVQGELGKQLDSLADMVTSGVVPGIVMVSLLKMVTIDSYGDGSILSYTFISEISKTENLTLPQQFLLYLPYLGLLLTLSACYRLGKFNIDTRQMDSFIGLPTPAMSLFVVSLPLIFASVPEETITIDLTGGIDNLNETSNLKSFYEHFIESMRNSYFLIFVTLGLSYLMNANLPLLSLKFKSFGFKKNVMKYLLILISIVMVITLKYLAVPLIIIVYILLSVMDNLSKQKQTVK